MEEGRENPSYKVRKVIRNCLLIQPEKKKKSSTMVDFTFSFFL